MSESHCNDAQLLALVDGELPSQTGNRVRRHLASCWQCRARLAELEEQMRILARAFEDQTFPGPARIADARERFILAAEQSERRPVLSPQFRMLSGFSWHTLRLAAVCLVLGAAAVELPRWSMRATRPARKETPVIGAVQRDPAPVIPELEKPAPKLSIPGQASPAPVRMVVRPTHAGPDDSEIEVLYALHRVRACMGEPIEIEGTPINGIRVSGLAQTMQRKTQLLAALAELRTEVTVSADIKTPEEVVHSVEGAGPGKPAARVRAGRLPIQDQLEKYFAEGGAGPGSLARLANEAVGASELLLADAWALRRLADRYSRLPVQNLRPQSRWLVEVMIRDHVTALHDQTRRAREILKPILLYIAGAAPTGEPPAELAEAKSLPDSVIAMFDDAEMIGHLIRGLFAGEGGVARGDEGARDLLAVISRLEARLEGMETQVTREFSGRPDLHGLQKGPEQTWRESQPQ